MKAREALHTIYALIEKETATHQHGQGNDRQTVSSLKLLTDKLSDFANIELQITSVAPSGKK